MKQLLPIFILAFALQGCKRKDCTIENPSISYNNISKSSLELTQYFTNPKMESIRFLSNKGDSLLFIKTKTDTSYFQQKESSIDCGVSKIINCLNITSNYQTIKGEGKFEVKHSKITRLDYNELIIENDLIEIIFKDYHFYFYEDDFFEIANSKYIGDFTVSDTIYKNVIFGWPNFSISSLGIKAYFAPKFGLVQVSDSINSEVYKIIKP